MPPSHDTESSPPAHLIPRDSLASLETVAGLLCPLGTSIHAIVGDNLLVRRRFFNGGGGGGGTFFSCHHKSISISILRRQLGSTYIVIIHIMYRCSDCCHDPVSSWMDLALFVPYTLPPLLSATSVLAGSLREARGRSLLSGATVYYNTSTWSFTSCLQLLPSPLPTDLSTTPAPPPVFLPPTTPSTPVGSHSSFFTFATLWPSLGWIWRYSCPSHLSPFD